MGKFDDAQYRKWFQALLAELESVADDEAFFGRRVTLHRPFTIRDWKPNGVHGGWYSVVATVEGATVEVWLDRYSDRDGDPHLGVWLEGDRTTIQRACAHLGLMQTYDKRNRDEDGFLRSAAARMLRGRVGQLVYDTWGPRAPVWVGGYVKASPFRAKPTDSLGLVVSSLRRLTEALDSRTPFEGKLQERYWEIVARLARPNQRLFRMALLQRHPVCSISGCTQQVLLDAAHIVPIRDHSHDDPAGDHADNGLMLRADLHRLFDADLLTITVGSTPRALLRVRVGADYEALQGRAVPALSDGQRDALRKRNARLAREGWASLVRDDTD